MTPSLNYSHKRVITILLLLKVNLDAKYLSFSVDTQPSEQTKKNPARINRLAPEWRKTTWEKINTLPTLTAAERSCEDRPIRPVITVASFPTTGDLKRSVNNRPISLDVHRRGRAVMRLSCVISRGRKEDHHLDAERFVRPTTAAASAFRPITGNSDIKRSFALAKQWSRPTPALTV